MKLEEPARSNRSLYVGPTESAEKFESEYGAFERALNPRDPIEQMQVEDVAYHNSKMLQRRRMAASILREASIEALYSMLSELGLDGSKAKTLVRRWMMNEPAAKAEVLAFLQAHGLDEASVEAKAFIHCRCDLTAVEQSESSHASRRDKALPNLAFYRKMKARQSHPRRDDSQQDDGQIRIEHLQGHEGGRGH